MTDKKNQHYIPKFYLKKFSYNNNEKQIGLFNINNEFFFPTATLKHQGSKDFFYGADGIIEDGLSSIEGKLAQTLKIVIEERKIPKPFSKEHINLLTFVGLTDLRNPVSLQNMKDLSKGIEARAKELDPDFDVASQFPEMKHEEVVLMALSQVSEIIKIMADLDYKLLVNRTTIPFITSDFPIAKYNQYLEHRKWEFGKCGYGNTGLQIIIPLNEELAIILYDSDVYNIGGKNKEYLGIIRDADVNQLNMLQLLNCFEHVYFNEKITENYIKELSSTASKYIRANEMHATLHYLADGKIEFQPKKENLIISGNTELQIKLKIEGVRFSPFGKEKKLSSTMSQMRPIPTHIIRQRDKRKQ